MSKQIIHTEVTKIYKEIVKNKDNNIDLYKTVLKNINNKKNEAIVINEVIKKLSDEYEIENISPLKIKKI